MKTQSRSWAYETVFILQPFVSDEEAASETEKIKRVIARYEGEVVGIENIGKKKLAYEIRNEKRGLFIVVHFKGNRNTVAELQRLCRLQEAILRFMTVKIPLQNLRLQAETKGMESPADNSVNKENVVNNVTSDGKL